MVGEIHVEAYSFSQQYFVTMTVPEVWLFGNPDLPVDSLPLRLLPQLQTEFPAVKFIIQDPLEEWPDREKLIIVDTVAGLEDIKVFTALDDFAESPKLTMHDFDLKTELSLRDKLGKLPPFVIIGLPSHYDESKALAELKPLLGQYLK